MTTNHQHGTHTYVLRVSGDSMVAVNGRTYPEGCVIYVDPDQRAGVVPGDKVVAKVNGAMAFRVLEDCGNKQFLRPLNPMYPAIHEEFFILGKVIGAFYGEEVWDH